MTRHERFKHLTPWRINPTDSEGNQFLVFDHEGNTMCIATTRQAAEMIVGAVNSDLGNAALASTVRIMDNLRKTS